MQVKFLQRLDQSLFFKKLSHLTLRHTCTCIIFCCMYFIPGPFDLSFQICTTESINASTNIFGRSFFIWMKVMTRNVHSTTLHLHRRSRCQKLFELERQKRIMKVSYFLIVHINSIKWAPCMSNSKWRRVKDILEYKKEVLSLRKISICTISDSHIVEEDVNYIFCTGNIRVGNIYGFDNILGYGHDPVSIWPVSCD